MFRVLTDILTGVKIAFLADFGRKKWFKIAYYYCKVLNRNSPLKNRPKCQLNPNLLDRIA